jgi:hypothetical protein
MRRGTGLHADQAWRQSREKPNHLAAPQLPSHNHLLPGVDAVDLKHVLGDIQTDRGNLHLDGSPHVIRYNDHPMALRCRERAPSTTSKIGIGGEPRGCAAPHTTVHTGPYTAVREGTLTQLYQLASSIPFAARSRSIRRAQPIADPGFGQDVFRLLDVILDLLPQLPDVHSQVLRVSQIVP